VREKKQDGGKGVGRLRERRRKYAATHAERANRKDEIARLTMSCGGQSVSDWRSANCKQI
jgi:hypothetical protein